MERIVQAQVDFSSGQIDDTAARRDDTEILRSSLRQARNVRILNAGGVRRRPGRRIVYAADISSFGVKPAVGERWWMDLGDGFARFRDADGTTVQTIPGLPWTAAMVPEIEWDIAFGTIIIVHQTMRPQIFRFDPNARSWSAEPFAFANDFGGIGSREPFYAYGGNQGITMKPSARAGAVTVDFSAPYLSPGHAGCRFNYAGAQLLCTAVTSSTRATMQVIDSLPQTLTLTIDSHEGFQLGDVVEGITSGASGFITLSDVGPEKPAQQITVIVNRKWQSFQVNEYVAGPRSRAKIMAVATATIEPAPSLVWDESFISDFRGWPGSVTFDRQRLTFDRFRQFGGAVCWSAIGSLSDFRVGASAADAIFEFLPKNCQVLHVAGGEDQFVFTDSGTFYIPISGATPLAPGSIDFRAISNDGACEIRPRLTAEGTVFVNSGRNRVMAIVSTGQQTQPYVAQDLTQNHASLIKRATSVAVTTTDRDVPERYLYVTNADGTMAVARYDAGRKAIGWVPWDGVGFIRQATSLEDMVGVSVQYPSGRFLEVFDDAYYLDAAQTLTEDLNQPPLTWMGGNSTSVQVGSWYRGAVPVLAGGVLAERPPLLSFDGAYTGLPFDVVVEPFIPNAPSGESHRQRLRRRRITQYAATVRGTTAIQVGGVLIPQWRAGEDQEQAPPLRSDTYRGRQFGRSFDPRWNVTQAIPGEFTLIEMTTEVTI